MDDDGFVFIVDRKKDLIKTSGFQVWPREIEEVISAHPAVLEVGVAGVPDPVKGEVAKAWVVLKPGEKATEDEVRAYCRERLAPYKVPGRVEFRTELPKTMVGKILRRALAADEARRAAIPADGGAEAPALTEPASSGLADDALAHGVEPIGVGRGLRVRSDRMHVRRRP